MFQAGADNNDYLVFQAQHPDPARAFLQADGYFIGRDGDRVSTRWCGHALGGRVKMLDGEQLAAWLLGYRIQPESPQARVTVPFRAEVE